MNPFANYYGGAVGTNPIDYTAVQAGGTTPGAGDASATNARMSGAAQEFVPSWMQPNETSKSNSTSTSPSVETESDENNQTQITEQTETDEAKLKQKKKKQESSAENSMMSLGESMSSSSNSFVSPGISQNVTLSS